MKCSLDISNFLYENSSLSHSVVFLYFFALITEEGFLISPCYSLELCIQMLISFLFSFAYASYLYRNEFPSISWYHKPPKSSNFKVLVFFPCLFVYFYLMILLRFFTVCKGLSHMEINYKRTPQGKFYFHIQYRNMNIDMVVKCFR